MNIENLAFKAIHKTRRENSHKTSQNNEIRFVLRHNFIELFFKRFSCFKRFMVHAKRINAIIFGKLQSFCIRAIGNNRNDFRSDGMLPVFTQSTFLNRNKITAASGY